jgi:FKBP-type peptidyl-prolyl cis-trans isomerase
MNRTARSFTLIGAAAAFLLISACESGVDREQAETAARNEQEGKSFLAENAKIPGVVTTASGLQYKVIKEGTGASPTAEDTVLVNYNGTFTSGEPFDDGENISFPLNGVIAGWTEGLQLMKEGSRYMFYIPSDLAYGDAGAGTIVPPKASLIFDVELIKVNPDVAPDEGTIEEAPADEAAPEEAPPEEE